MHPDEYHKMAAAEDRLWYYRALHGHVIRSVRSKGGAADGSLLDAGCGTGGLLRRLHAACPAMQLSGLDFSPVACALARQRTEAKISEGSIVAVVQSDWSAPSRLGFSSNCEDKRMRRLARAGMAQSSIAYVFTMLQL